MCTFKVGDDAWFSTWFVWLCIAVVVCTASHFLESHLLICRFLALREYRAGLFHHSQSLTFVNYVPSWILLWCQWVRGVGTNYHRQPGMLGVCYTSPGADVLCTWVRVLKYVYCYDMLCHVGLLTLNSVTVTNTVRVHSFHETGYIHE